MDKGGYRSIASEKSLYSALEAIVYCKDCEYWIPPQPEVERETRGSCCENYGLAPKADWFCADGKKKEGGKTDEGSA